MCAQKIANNLKPYFLSNLHNRIQIIESQYNLNNNICINDLPKLKMTELEEYLKKFMINYLPKLIRKEYSIVSDKASDCLKMISIKAYDDLRVLDAWNWGFELVEFEWIFDDIKRKEFISLYYNILNSWAKKYGS